MKFNIDKETKEAGIIIFNRLLEKPLSPALLLFIEGETYIDSGSLLDMPVMRVSSKPALFDDLLTYWNTINCYALEEKHLLVPLDSTLRELSRLSIKHKSIAAIGSCITIILSAYYEAYGKHLVYGKDYTVVELVQDLYSMFFATKRSYKEITSSMAKLYVNPVKIEKSVMDKALIQIAKWIQ